MSKALFGAGCFWGPEKKFSEIKGVIETQVGYSQGLTDKTSYEEVCKGNTNHAEVVFLKFDENLVSYTNLVEFFYQIHDPTTLNQQGPDRGSQYRSLIGYYDETQCEIAKQITDKLNESQFNQKITTILISSISNQSQKFDLSSLITPSLKLNRNLLRYKDSVNHKEFSLR